MRNLLIAFFSIIASTSFGQDVFSGKIEMKMELSGEDADQMAAFMPDKLVYQMSDGNFRFDIEGGMMAAMMGYFVFDGKNTYMVKESEKTAYKMPADSDSETSSTEKPKVVKTSETEVILGYTCTKYIVTTTDGSGEENIQHIWATTAIKLPSGMGEINGSSLVEGVEGFPLKTSSEIDEGIVMTMVVSKIDAGPVAQSVFEIPASYEIKDFDPSSMIGNY